MKKLLSLLFLITLLISCSSDDDPKTSGQDYTSFVIKNSTTVNMDNTVIGYLVDGKYKKLASLGDFKKGATSPEIRVEDKSITQIYVFTDYNDTRRIDVDFILKKNIKNIFEITSDSKTTKVDKTDPTKYPQ